MMTGQQDGPVYRWATVQDWEKRTGTALTPEQADVVQQQLDDACALFALWMPPGCIARAQAGDPAVLAVLVPLLIAYTQRQENVPAGIASETIGTASVTYITDREQSAQPGRLSAAERAALAQLCGTAGLRMVPVQAGGGTACRGPR
jgi:hypothetical protein